MGRITVKEKQCSVSYGLLWKCPSTEGSYSPKRGFITDESAWHSDCTDASVSWELFLHHKFRQNRGVCSKGRQTPAAHRLPVKRDAPHLTVPTGDRLLPGLAVTHSKGGHAQWCPKLRKKSPLESVRKAASRLLGRGLSSARSSLLQGKPAQPGLPRSLLHTSGGGWHVSLHRDSSRLVQSLSPLPDSQAPVCPPEERGGGGPSFV